MADVRALLKAKRQEIKISHPLATYTSSGQLRCRVCSTSVKHASAWEGHIGSKAHRMNVAQLREEEKRRAQQDEAQQELHETAGQQMYSSVSTGKRKADDSGQSGMQVELSSQENDTKRRRTQPASKDGFPADFFSDPSRAPIPIRHPGDDDEAVPPESNPPPDTSIQQQIDLEYARFQQEMLGNVQKQSDDRELYERATVVAEPELALPDEGSIVPQSSDSQMDVDVKERQTEEESMRRQKELDERELIMDRLLDEERAQEEADQRVAALKARLEAIKKKRKSTKQPAT